eukprot:438327_1
MSLDLPFFSLFFEFSVYLQTHTCALTMGSCITTKQFEHESTPLDNQKKLTDIPTGYKLHHIRPALSKRAWCRVIRAIEKPRIEHLHGDEEQKEVAIKIFTKIHQKNRLLFENEVSILSSINHPNIVEFVGSAEDDSNFYIATKFCSGHHLFDRAVNSHYRMTEKDVIAIIYQILKAVQYLHGNNIAHRDISATNILAHSPSLISRFDLDITLMGFGNAVRLQNDIEYSDNINLAPEILKSADVWSVGVIAYILMIGTPPEIDDGHVQFPTDQLHLSEHFKDFIHKILHTEAHQRLTAEDASRHPWIQGSFAVDTIKRLWPNINALRQFNYELKLKNIIARTWLFEREIKRFIEQRKEVLMDYVKEKYIANIIDEYVEHISLDCLECFSIFDNVVDVGLYYLLMDVGLAPSEALKQARSNESLYMIDFECFRKYLYGLTLSKLDRYLHAIFSVLDDAGDGYLDARTMVNVLGDHFPVVLRDCTDLDEPGIADGNLSFSEFQSIMQDEFDTEDLCLQIEIF